MRGGTRVPSVDGVGAEGRSSRYQGPPFAPPQARTCHHTGSELPTGSWPRALWPWCGPGVCVPEGHVGRWELLGRARAKVGVVGHSSPLRRPVCSALLPWALSQVPARTVSLVRPAPRPAGLSRLCRVRALQPLALFLQSLPAFLLLPPHLCFSPPFSTDVPPSVLLHHLALFPLVWGAALGALGFPVRREEGQAGCWALGLECRPPRALCCSCSESPASALLRQPHGSALSQATLHPCCILHLAGPVLPAW